MFTRGTPTFGYFWKQPIKTKHSITIQVIQYEISSYLFPELSSPGNSAILWSVGHHHRGLNPPCTVSCPVCLPGELCWLPRDVSWCTRTGRGHPTPICNGCRLFLGQHNTHQLKLLKKNKTNICLHCSCYFNLTSRWILQKVVILLFECWLIWIRCQLKSSPWSSG